MKLKCHYCGYEKRAGNKCPSCGKQGFDYFGKGTERIEEEIQNRLKNAKICRLDSDTMKSKKKMEEYLNSFYNKKYNILVGTQMVTKGHNFPGVSLVCVIEPERVLSFPDFRSGERVFSQLVQVSGRAGRGVQQGSVIVQTSMSDNYAIKYGLENNYNGFYTKELAERKELNYPPFVKLMRFVIRGVEEEKVIQDSFKFKKELETLFTNEAEILGPAPCVLQKINKNYRWNIIFKILKYREFREKIEKIKKISTSPGNYLEVDMDPVNIL